MALPGLEEVRLLCLEVLGLVFNFVYPRAVSSSLVVFGRSWWLCAKGWLGVFANTNLPLDLNSLSKNTHPCKG